MMDEYVIEQEPDLSGFYVWHRPTIRKLQFFKERCDAESYIKERLRSEARRAAGYYRVTLQTITEKLTEEMQNGEC